jgi:DNA-binding LacI/PurR family transcriptional regulator
MSRWVGFDDIPSAVFNSGGITTSAPETASMGQIAAKTVIDQIEGNGEYIAQIATEPDLWCRPRPNRFRLCW